MKLNLDILPAGLSDLKIDESYGGGAADDMVAQGVLRVENTDSRVLIGGVLETRIAAECDRCLEPFELTYHAEINLQIIRTTTSRGGEEADVWTRLQAHGEIELKDAIHEALKLAAPLKRVCREDCLGICAHCGANRNLDPCACDQEFTDPRWDGLPA